MPLHEVNLLARTANLADQQLMAYHENDRDHDHRAHAHRLHGHHHVSARVSRT